jgi:hypothetical protein
MGLSEQKEARAEQITTDAIVRLEREFANDPMEDFIEALEILHENVLDRLSAAKEEV